MGASSPEQAASLRSICRRDILFWLNTFGWIYEPRIPATRPWITWDFQDELIPDILQALGKHDIGIVKSRDMGATWVCLAVLLHQWQFERGRAFKVASRSAELVDGKKGDPDTLFWKLDFLLEHQPTWLKPLIRDQVERQKAHLFNPDEKSVLGGAATTEDFGRGGRSTGMMLDELGSWTYNDGMRALSATQFNTNCRIFNSTPKGAVGAFYTMLQKVRHKISLHWSLHPEKGKGIYTDEKGRKRSPWYDIQCSERSASDRLVAQDLDMDFLASGGAFFDVGRLDDIIRRDCREPYHQGRLEYDRDTLEAIEWVEDPKGACSLWFRLGPDGKPARDTSYVMGADVSTGTGASSSCLVAASKNRLEKVMEYANPRINSSDFANEAMAYCKWFGDAFLVWEAVGPGLAFGKRLIMLGYRNFYRKRDDAALTPKASDIPGWYPSPEAKLKVLTEYNRALGKEWVERSMLCLDDAKHYVFNDDGFVDHAKIKNLDDPSGARINHGDRVIATALAWKLLQESGAAEIKIQTGGKDILPGCLAWRRKLVWENERKQTQEVLW